MAERLTLHAAQDGAIPVMFRMFKREAIAVFPCEAAGPSGNLMVSYQLGKGPGLFELGWLGKTTPIPGSMVMPILYAIGGTTP